MSRSTAQGRRLTPATRAAAAQQGAGIARIVLSVACFGALDTTSKLVTGSVPVVMALWVRDVVQTLATGALLLPRHGLRLLHTRQHGRHALRAALLVAGNAGFQLLTRAMTRDDAPGTIHLYSGLGGLALTSATLPLAWQPLDAHQWLLLGLMGLFGAAGHFLLIVAYAKAPVAVLTPCLYLQILFATLGGWLVFSHLPDQGALAGMALVAVCGVVGTWLARREALAAALGP